MAVLSDTARQRVVAQWMRENRTAVAFTKPDLAGAVAAIDQWIEDNMASLNAALPAGYRTTATLAQKVDLFCDVLRRRAGKHRAEEDG
jgi:hypothetical protein